MSDTISIFKSYSVGDNCLDCREVVAVANHFNKCLGIMKDRQDKLQEENNQLKEENKKLKAENVYDSVWKEYPEKFREKLLASWEYELEEQRHLKEIEKLKEENKELDRKLTEAVKIICLACKERGELKTKLEELNK